MIFLNNSIFIFQIVRVSLPSTGFYDVLNYYGSYNCRNFFSFWWVIQFDFFNYVFSKFAFPSRLNFILYDSCKCWKLNIFVSFFFSERSLFSWAQVTNFWKSSIFTDHNLVSNFNSFFFSVIIQFAFAIIFCTFY